MTGRLRAYARPGITLLFIVAGFLLWLRPGTAQTGATVWLIGLALTGAPVVWGTVRGILIGRWAADVVATLAILTALALRHPLAGLIVVLMQTGGEALERYAAGRASAAVRDLEAAAPRTAHRYRHEEVEDIPVDLIRVDDELLVRPGDLIPCDGIAITGRSNVDTSRLTGEPIPVEAGPGTVLLSGSLNGAGALRMRATALARESQYALIVELVRTAQASKAPLQRLADRYAVWFTPLTLVACLVAFAWSGEAERILAILVVATPCPLILATPVAIIGGVNRCAQHQVIVRTGAALEQLSRVTVGVFDKTGTLTIGRPQVKQVVALAPFTEHEVLRLAGAIEQQSSHLLARTLVEAATAREIRFPEAHHVVEAPGSGIQGTVEEKSVSVGSLAYLKTTDPSAAVGFAELGHGADGVHAFVAVEGKPAGMVEYADRIRPELGSFLARLNALGIRRTILLSGDITANAVAVGKELGIQEIHGDLLPRDKVDLVRQLVDAGQKVLMVGDGTNDAPALSTATVGVALAAHGGGITAEAADMVVLADDLNRVADAVAISQRTMHIARQSIWVGLGLSGLAMIIAGLGYIPPTVGALLQEGIDVTVILNAVRASAS
ncbi:MAG: heavy metal translocating P-type ATPase [Gemmatimonadales bacterium]|nr:MAG: heavy metal translocating P-type ATPase [Gemmatimonadales bacterium]